MSIQIFLYFLKSLYLSHSEIFYHCIKVFIMFYSCSASKKSVQAGRWESPSVAALRETSGLQKSSGHSFSRSQSTEAAMFTLAFVSPICRISIQKKADGPAISLCFCMYLC